MRYFRRMESQPLFKDSPDDPGAKPANPIGAIVQRSSHGLNLVSLRRGLSGWKSEALLGLGLLLVGMFLFFRVDQIPGDFEDARFNMYVLEHGYRWLVGLDKSFCRGCCLPLFVSEEHAFVFASVVTYTLAGLSRRTAGYKRVPHLLMGISILGLTVVDQVSGVTGKSKRECKRRVAELEATIVHTRGDNVARNVLWVYENSANAAASRNRELNNYNFIQKNLDAMLAGQALGLNVVNGYSGYLPKNYPPAVFFMTRDCCVDLGVWARMHAGTITNNSLL